MKAKLKSYEFWVSVVSAIMVVLQSISIKFNLPYIQETVMGFLGILAVAGIIKKKEKTVEDTSNQDAIDSVLTKESKESTLDDDILPNADTDGKTDTDKQEGIDADAANK